jgi:hypothetical protein
MTQLPSLLAAFQVEQYVADVIAQGQTLGQRRRGRELRQFGLKLRQAGFFGLARADGIGGAFRLALNGFVFQLQIFHAIIL